MISANSPYFYDEIGKDIVEEGIFMRFPELIPAVGDNYWREDGKHRKMLLIGESNYFPESLSSESIFMDAEQWYRGDATALIPESIKDAVSNWTGYPPFVKVFKFATNELIANGVPVEPAKGPLDEMAFYNYFLRPALNDGKNKGFKAQAIDEEVAGTALTGIIEKLTPDLVVFVSKSAYNSFVKYCNRHSISFPNVHIDAVAHPSCAWWNRGGGWNGHEKFRNLLNEYWITK